MYIQTCVCLSTVFSDSCDVPLALTVSAEHRPVVESQLPAISTHPKAFDGAHPNVEQSPTRMSSRAKSLKTVFPPVNLASEGRGHNMVSPPSLGHTLSSTWTRT